MLDKEFKDHNHVHWARERMEEIIKTFKKKQKILKRTKKKLKNTVSEI